MKNEIIIIRSDNDHHTSPTSYSSNRLTWLSQIIHTLYSFCSKGRLHYWLTSFGRRSFAVSGPAAWNSLSPKL